MKAAWISLILVLMTGQAWAADGDRNSWADGFYFGIGAGAIRFETDLASIGMTPLVEPIESNNYAKTSLTLNFFAGYRIMDYLGVEVGYFNTQQTEQSYCFIDVNDDNGCDEDRQAAGRDVSSSAWSVEVPAKAFHFSAIGYLPVMKTINLTGRVGMVYSDIEARSFEKLVGGFIPPKAGSINPPQNGSRTVKISDNEWDPLIGLGLEFNTEGGFGIKTEIQYMFIEQLDDPWMASFGIFYTL